MKKLLPLLMLTLFAMCSYQPAYSGFEGLNDGASLKIFNRINCDSTINCSRLKDVFTISAPGGLQNQIIASSATITSSQCGSTFAVGSANNFDINPDDNDRVLIETDSSGDIVRSATLGNSLTIEATSDGFWTPISVIGTWTDQN